MHSLAMHQLIALPASNTEYSAAALEQRARLPSNHVAGRKKPPAQLDPRQRPHDSR